MNQEDQNTTKLQILNVARGLFAKSGYDAVSIRDIGRVVGIRESSIYYHFKNKQEIFDRIIDQMNLVMDGVKYTFMEQLSSVQKVRKDEFILTGWMYLEMFLLNNEIYETISMLQIEKQRNQKALSCYQKVMFEMPIEHQSNVFQVMKEKGLLRKEEKEKELAMEYQSMILMVFQRYFPCLSLKEENLEIARHTLEQLLGRFYEQYLTMEGNE